jgi:predicted Zn-ribbon and HTH transcriptional regulator
MTRPRTSADSPEPPERQDTVRAELRRALHDGRLTAHELSARVGVPERQVAGHLEHLARSLRAGGARLVVEPAWCLDCGFVFSKRDRLSRPSRCPACRGSHLDPPRFAIVAK